MNFQIKVIFLIGILHLSVFGYFQQSVCYKINIKLIPSLHRLEGTEMLSYHNHSLDTLSYVYFHLYMNRFRKLMGENKNINKPSGYIEVVSVKDGNLEDLNHEINKTVMKVYLKKVILPGDSHIFKIRFNTVLPEASERFGYYGDHYDVGNWYPVPAVYDQYGWHADQHIRGEFYQEWGNYQVNITVPKGFIVAASGSLQNPEVLPDSIEFPNRRLKNNYLSDTSTVTYKFYAPNVHDFAWSADPEFVVRSIKINDIHLKFYIQPYQVSDWESQLGISKKAINYFERVIGKYPYSCLNVIDGYITTGGIEYPNLVIINNYISNTRDLSATIIHEIAHQWFYGLLANNQTRYGWMDEGFATYFENLAMQEVYSKSYRYVHSPTGVWGKWLGYDDDFWQRDLLTYQRYIRSGMSEPIDTPFDWFQNDPYIPSYQKMSLVISQLRLVLGDSIFWMGIKDYYRTWRFRHPYPKDLFSCFEKVSERNLNWFFDEWLNTTWVCDYSIDGIWGEYDLKRSHNIYEANIRFKREKSIVMPLDFRVHLNNGLTLDYRIPVGDGQTFFSTTGQKFSPWSYTEAEKSIHLSLPDKIKKVEIDPEHRLLDVNPFNNETGFFPKMHFYFLRRQYLFPRTDGYTTTIFPHVFYNRPDGLQLGIRTRGNYIYPDYQHRLLLLFGLLSLKPEINFWFEHPIYALRSKIHYIINAYDMSGRWGMGGWLQYINNDKSSKFQVMAGWQYRRIYDLDYIPNPVSQGNLSFIDISMSYSNWDNSYLPSGYELFSRSETAFLGSSYSYRLWSLGTRCRFSTIRSQKLSLDINTGGQYGNVPIQKYIRPGGESTYGFLTNPYLRTRGTLPISFWREGHLFQSGEGKIRSLANNWQKFGTHFLSGEISFTLGNPLNISTIYIPYLSDIILSTYGSATTWSEAWGEFDHNLAEGGVSIVLTRLPFLFYFFDIEQMHFDIPFWVNDNIDDNNLKFRWVFSMDIRSFY